MLVRLLDILRNFPPLLLLTLSLSSLDVDQRASTAEDARTEVVTRPLETSWWAGKTNSEPPPLVGSGRRNGTASSPILTICRYGTYRLLCHHSVDKKTLYVTAMG